MVLNQQLEKEQSKDFYNKMIDIIGDWKPYVTNYCELKEKGWYKKYDSKNEYVSEKIKDNEVPYIKQYHFAWSNCPYKKELIDLIKSVDYIDTVPALEVFKEITGIVEEDDEVAKDIKLLEQKGKLVDGRILV